ncbi:hypothetical protein AYO49_06095 [Verrucomicrobiaceae bacterium SCGC AG-212-N21]|nr:hypothetical protein AYO49_06095 [Verrucomicrobiaceae bacterium SCGC AG-212-N21]
MVEFHSRTWHDEPHIEGGITFDVQVFAPAPWTKAFYGPLRKSLRWGNENSLTRYHRWLWQWLLRRHPEIPSPATKKPPIRRSP